MGKDMPTRKVVLAVLCALLLAILAAGMLAAMAASPMSCAAKNNATVQASGASRADLAALYAKAAQAAGEKVSLEVRMDAARRLVRSEQAEPWTALLLLSSQLRPTGTEMEQRRREGVLRRFELAVTAAAIYALPARTKASTLFALTELLVETNKGVWSEERWVLLVKRISEHRSPPIRELARDHLKARLGVDHGWDADAWRKAILEMAIAEQAGKTPGTLPSATVLSPQSQPSPSELTLMDDLTAGRRDLINCAVTYVEQHGGPSLPSVPPGGLSEWQAIGKRSRDWLLRLTKGRRPALAKGYADYKLHHSPIFAPEATE